MSRKPKPRTKAGTSKSAAEERRKAFAHAYIANGRNGTQAAITAGFSPKCAEVTGSELLREAKVQAMIAELAAPAAKAAGLSVERTLQEVARLAYFDPRSLYRADGNLKRPDEWDDDTAAAVAALEVSEEFTGSGEERELTGRTKKLKLWDKNAALEKAMKHLGLYERDNAQQRDNLQLQVVLVGPP